uniref:Uncharacterized protein n=1 Tax=Panagrolaimus sp. JU765 TaxID=591449 RepID=A0AC34QTS1_9BILA
MVSVSTQLPKELPKVSAQKSVGVVVENSYAPVRNRLAEQDQRPMNQTYTIGTRQLMAPSAKPRERSCSIDSDIADYSIQGALSGLFPRTFAKPNGASPTPTRNPSNGHGSLTRIFSTKLPSLEGCSPERKCCQRTFGRAQMDLQKYKDNLKSSINSM